MNSIKLIITIKKTLQLKYQIILWGLLFIIILFAGCATVGVNNYQNAETIGKKNLKAGLAVEMGRTMDAGIHIFEGDIYFNNDLDWDDYTFPIVGLTGQYGITGSTDIGITLSSAILPISGSMAIHLKQNIVHTPRDFAIAFMPGGGIYGSVTEGSGTPLFDQDNRYENKYEYRGYLIDIPAIISKRWSFFSLHLSPKYMYSSLNIKTDYKEFRKSDDTLVLHNTDEETYDFNTFGASAGLSFIFKHFQITPEVSCLRVKNLPKDTFHWVLYPGLGLYLKF